MDVLEIVENTLLGQDDSEISFKYQPRVPMRRKNMFHQTNIRSYAKVIQTHGDGLRISEEKLSEADKSEMTLNMMEILDKSG